MQWLKRKVLRWVKDDWNNSAKVAMAEESPRRKEFDDISSSETIRFNLTPAVGGRILRVTRESNYQKSLNTIGSTDTTQIYVIPSGEDVGQRVAKIINIELLK